MGQPLHGSARATAAVHRAIPQSHESLQVLCRRYGIHPKTVSKGNKRMPVTDASMGLRQPTFTVLTKEHAALIAAFRRPTLLPRDDGPEASQAPLPHLTRPAR